jgi:hypothetical protein
LEGVLLEDHVVGELLGLSNVEHVTLNTELSGRRSELENLVTPCLVMSEAAKGTNVRTLGWEVMRETNQV